MMRCLVSLIPMIVVLSTVVSSQYSSYSTTSFISCPTHRPFPPSHPISNGLALTPPMGWSSWNMFGADISEHLIRDTIDTMAANGLQAAGFKYVNLDDGWQRYSGSRVDNPLEVDPVKFPSGMKALADYAHSKGFKLGIYSGPGDITCAGYTASGGHEEEDAAMFASWGIDHLKYDACCSYETAPKCSVQEAILTMSKALLKSRRPIVYHACYCGWQDIWEWAAAEGANQWRIGQDISDDFNFPGNREDYYFDVLDMLDRGNSLVKYSGPGHWNDYDMLIVGLNGNSTQLVGTGASNVEYRTHFSMWAMVASPLLIGSDVRLLSPYDLQTFTNPEIVALNQDPLGIAAVVVTSTNNGTVQIYAKRMVDRSVAFALLNRGTATALVNFDPREHMKSSWHRYRLRDLWKHVEGVYNDTYYIEVMPHEAKVFRVWRA